MLDLPHAHTKRRLPEVLLEDLLETHPRLSVIV